uniref:Fatty acid hydroxylase domain-containing protein n=1 Tax=Scophthalmus maximus TaxID=52904 RepID=A0A8D3A3V3_SCOMX
MAQYRRGLYTQLLLFLCSGRPRRTVGLREESCVRHWIRNLTLGCIRQLADMASSEILGSFRRFLAELVDQAVLGIRGPRCFFVLFRDNVNPHCGILGAQFSLLLWADTTGKPSFITRYRIQVDKNNPVDPAKLRSAMKTVVFNLFFLSGPMVVGVYHLTSWRGNPCGPELPTFHWALTELAIFSIIEEIMFYYSHRLFHHPSFYKHYHKQHHEWTAPIGLICIYAHPLEHVISNMLPVVMGPMVLGSHLATTSLWYCLVLWSTTISHCGYHLPFLPSPEFHDFHHLRFTNCFGVLGVLDRLHGTDSKFRQTKQYERHVLLTGLTPLNESIPDAPKKGQ